MLRPVALLLVASAASSLGRVAGRCPEPSVVAPCQCEDGALLVLECNFATQEDVERVFAAEFPVTNFDKLSIYGGNVSKLTEMSNGLTFVDVYINSQELEMIGEDFFSNSSQVLEKVNIPNSALETEGFPFDSLHLYTKLTELSIEGTRTFKGTLPAIVSDSLLKVKFGFTDISEVNSDTFKGATRLQSIDLTACALTELGPHTFTLKAGVANELSLSLNDITSVHPDTFILPGAGENPTGTTVALDLYHNAVESVDEQVYRALVDLNTPALNWRLPVDLDGNPVACDCDEYWMVMGSPDGELPYSRHISGECADGTHFEDLNRWDFPDC